MCNKTSRANVFTKGKLSTYQQDSGDPDLQNRSHLPLFRPTLPLIVVEFVIYSCGRFRVTGH